MLAHRLGTLLALSSITTAQTLVLDINQAPLVDPEPEGGFYGHLELNGELLFSASTEATGSELWKTDGTTAGTQMVEDLWPGIDSSAPSSLRLLPNGTVVMTAVTSPVGREIFKTDGTAAGTKIVYDVRGGPETSNPHDLTVFGDYVYFLANDNVHGSEWWRTDGTTAGTELFLDVVPGPSSHNNGTSDVLVVGDTLFFSALDAGWDGWYLWKSDGTAAGTEVIEQLNDHYLDTLGYLTEFQDKLFFTVDSPGLGEELWVSDGTAAGTHVLIDIVAGSGSADPRNLTVAGDKLFFSAWQGGSGRELWVSDGTAAGTELVADLSDGTFTFSSNPLPLSTFSNHLLFTANTPNFGTELWISNGTAAATQLVADLEPGPAGSIASWGVKIGSLYYFRGTTTATGTELYVTDGSAAGTHVVADIVPGPGDSDVGTINALGSSVIFGADDGVTGTEPWISDGTAAGTEQLVNIGLPAINASGNPAAKLTFEGRVYFAANDPATGVELWSSDGTPGGTELFLDIVPGTGSSGPTPLAVWNGRMYFKAGTPDDGIELWSTDGTPQNTSMLIDLAPGAASSSPSRLTPFDGRLFFSANDGGGYELWSTDGTAAGTSLFIDTSTWFGGSSPSDLTVVDDLMYMILLSDAEGSEVWVTDGTLPGTHIVNDTWPGPDSGVFHPAFTSGTIRYLIEFDGNLYFSGNDGVNGFEVWRTDGTAAGTEMVIDLYPGEEDADPYLLRVFGDSLLFNGDDGTAKRLYHTDGTAAGTELLVDDYVTRFIDNGESLLFFRDNDSTDTNLWSFDGQDVEYVTTLDPFGYGTWSLTSLVPGPGPVALFQGFSDAHGSEIWRTDGTAGGTYRVTDVAPEGLNAAPTFFERVGDTMLFTADDGLLGSELHAISLSSVGAYVAANFGEGCLGSTGIPTIGVEGPVTVGSTFDLVVDETPPSSVVLPAFSLDAIDADLGAGCSLYLAAPAFLPALISDPSGKAAMPISPTASLVGVDVYFQAVVADAGGALLGIASLTGGLEVVVGS